MRRCTLEQMNLGMHSKNLKVRTLLQHRQRSWAAIYVIRLTCDFSARTMTAALLFLVLNTGVRPAMLPRLERLPARRVDAQGTARALEVAATCMIALFATSGVSEVASSDRGALCKTYLHSDPSREAAFSLDGQLRLARQLIVVSPKEQEPNSST